MGANRNLIIKLRSYHNKYYIVLKDYEGQKRIDQELLDAIQEQLSNKYNGNQIKEFVHIEIVGEEP